jgi:biotin transport system substrate-specific component
MFKNSLRLTGIKYIDEGIFIALSFLALIYLGGIRFDITEGLPITLQSLLVVWFALVFGTRVGITAVILYLIVGGLGLGVFSGGASGWQHFLGSTGGFLIAFPIGAFISGSAAEWASKKSSLMKKAFIISALILFTSQTAILLLGLVWQNALTLSPINLGSALNIFMPGLLIKTALGTIAFVVLGRTLSRTSIV